MIELSPGQSVLEHFQLVRPLRKSRDCQVWLMQDQRSAEHSLLWLGDADLDAARFEKTLAASGLEQDFEFNRLQDTAALVINRTDPASIARLLPLLDRLTGTGSGIPAAGEDLIEAGEFQSVTPVDFREPATQAELPGPASPTKRTVPGTAVISIALILLVLAFTVFQFLPEFSGQPTPTEVATSTQAPAASGAPATQTVGTGGGQELAPWQIAQTLRQKEAAEAVLEEFVRRQFELEEQNVQVWAEEAYAAAIERAQTGDAAFSQRDYESASGIYQEGVDMLDALLLRSGEVLEEALAVGQAALEAFDSAGARAAFDLALAVDPENQLAKSGLKRTETLDQVAGLMESARTSEQQGDLRGARQEYAQVVQIDPAVQDAGTAVARIDKILADQGFRQLMSDGYGAMAEGRLEAARTAFQKARRLRPGSAEVTEALAQVDMELRTVRIAGYRQKAEALDGEERWRDAVAQYEAALKLDPNLAFARRGAAYSRERAELDERMADYIARPERLSADGVYESATQVLTVAKKLQPTGPRLKEQIGQLERLMKISRLPVQVRIESDNQTQVTVYKVGRLGTFLSRQLELRPGSYTAVGTRNGYRDVRREFTVQAGKPPGPIVVRCEDKI